MSFSALTPGDFTTGKMVTGAEMAQLITNQNDLDTRQSITLLGSALVDTGSTSSTSTSYTAIASMSVTVTPTTDTVRVSYFTRHKAGSSTDGYLSTSYAVNDGTTDHVFGSFTRDGNITSLAMARSVTVTPGTEYTFTLRWDTSGTSTTNYQRRMYVEDIG